MGIIPTGTNYGFIVDVSASVVGMAAVSACTRWETARIVSMAVLAGFSYGTLNDVIACRECIEYYTLGHFYDGRNLRSRLVNTLDPDINALAWGMAATWHIALIGGSLLALAARFPFSKVAEGKKVTVSQLTPYVTGLSLLALFTSHITSALAKRKMAESPYLKYNDVPLDLQAGWEACNIRNSTGYIVLGIGSVALSACVVAYRAGLIGRKEETKKTWYAKVEHFFNQAHEQGLLASITNKLK